MRKDRQRGQVTVCGKLVVAATCSTTRSRQAGHPPRIASMWSKRWSAIRSASSAGAIQARRRYAGTLPQLTTINVFMSLYETWYDALQVVFQRRLNQGLSFNTHYQLAHAQQTQALTTHVTAWSYVQRITPSNAALTQGREQFLMTFRCTERRAVLCQTFLANPQETGCEPPESTRSGNTTLD